MTEHRSVHAVVLAAGGSTRLQTPKQLLSWRGQPLIRRVVETALASLCERTIVVLGAHADRVRLVIADLPVIIVENHHWQDGKASSIRLGVQAALEQNDQVRGILFLTCDQPLVTGALFHDMLARFDRSGCDTVVACAYADTVGIPAVIPRRLFDPLQSLTGDEGAQGIIASEPEVITVPFPDGAIDIDTPDDLRALDTGPATE